MDVTSKEFDYNLFLESPNWQFKNTNNAKPDPTKLCPVKSDNPQDWINAATCTTQNIYMNTGKSCPNLGGHVNWFPVTYKGALSWSDKSNAGSDDDYNFNIQRPDEALYTGTNDHIRLEFDSDETVDNWDNTGVFWERFHHEIDDDDRNGRILIHGQFAIVIGLVGLDGGHDAFDSEIHPVYGMFVHMKDDPNDDRWSFFIRNWGNEGWCSSGQENLYRSILQVIIPHEKTDDYDFNGETNVWVVNQKPGMGVSSEKCDAGILLTFTFDEPERKGCFVGDLGIVWKGTNLKPRNDFNNPVDNPSPAASARKDEIEDGERALMEKINQLDQPSKKELTALLGGRIVSEKFPLYPKPQLTQITKDMRVSHTTQSNLDSVNKKIAQLKRKKSLPNYREYLRSVPDSSTMIRKQMRQELIVKFLRSKGIE